jgi:hypothetical protein
MLVEVYADLVPESAPKAGATPAAATPAAEGAAKKASPLDQLKAKKKAAPAADGEKKLSPLEQMKAKAAKKKAGGGEGAGEKKLSPLEQMKAKAAAKKQAAEGAGDGEVAKKLSPLEQMKAKAAAKKQAAEGGGEEKKLSPLEQMKAKAAAKKQASGEGAPEKKLSPLEQMKAKAAAKKKAMEIPEDAGQTINFSPEQAAMLADQADRMQPESFDADAEPDGPIILPCPECEHEMKLPDRSLLGRKARCPLCSFKFVLELPEVEKPVAVAAASPKGGPSALKQAMLQDASAGKPGGKVSPLEAARKQAAGGGTATAEKPLVHFYH